MKAKLCALILFPLALSSARATECTFAHAKYLHTADTAWTMSFHRFGHQVLLSDMAVQVESAASKASFWFLLDAGSSRYINFISTTDVLQKDWQPPTYDGGQRPLGEMHAFFWNKDMKIIETMPKAESPAPEVIFLPDLSEILASRAAIKHELRSGMFKLFRCER
ncbi:hypothetical protein [Luteibacter yeojuensis]|uniref:Uncharacterized protein n=1 Tax=Luteibacter yeojuensis TaxID=345309 RepID=A0A7X5TMY9_9GAMM|nr:hypothetical protein [Luteibacter yeojuensis]NID14221.1 hypothetical protein [Luteibacter yeojuensis]